MSKREMMAELEVLRQRVTELEAERIHMLGWLKAGQIALRTASRGRHH